MACLKLFSSVVDEIDAKRNDKKEKIYRMQENDVNDDGGTYLQGMKKMLEMINHIRPTCSDNFLDKKEDACLEWIVESLLVGHQLTSHFPDILFHQL